VSSTTIYTRAGDDGTSATLGGSRESKTGIVFDACGTLDELSAFLGAARAALPQGSREAALLLSIQRDSVNLGAYLSSGDSAYLDRLALDDGTFETEIDRLLQSTRITGFVIPGNTAADAALHVARTVCRRLERRFWALDPSRRGPRAATYLNRLSDLLFALAVSQSGLRANEP